MREKQENIYLIGFMGSGKTTLAKRLSQALGYEEIDLDQEIIAFAKQSIPSLFEKHGEAYFRQIESEVLSQVTEKQGRIVATGGGIVTQGKNRKYLKERQTIYLKWPFEILYERIKGDTNRPLVKSYEGLKALYEARESLYEEAACYIVEGNDQSEEALTEIIIRLIGGGK